MTSVLGRGLAFSIVFIACINNLFIIVNTSLLSVAEIKIQLMWVEKVIFGLGGPSALNDV